MTPDDPDRDPVDVLAEEFADRLRRGERPSVSDYAAAHPAHADQLRDLLPAVAQMEQLKKFRKAAPAPSAASLPDRLGDFRIVRELGRGGMGVVFEAVQESLGRRVALKVLASHAQLDAEKRERFVREAKAAARLHHTNIVPVFGVGEQDGLPYYVMQLIPGRSLHEIIADWRTTSGRDTAAGKARGHGSTATDDWTESKADKPPSASNVGPALNPHRGDWNLIADVGAQAADALHYAHDQGVLHRDVKPGNLILDDRGQVWVADFGLAKLVDTRTLTATGHVLGTLQYLAPECLHGEADARSDVYGLGATLYELLTLHPPFNAVSPVQLMKLIADATPPPPRALNPHVPHDLETIVLKAMAHDPRRRYASAELFADDLRAFLEDRPIRARRESLLERGWRWCRHHRAVAALTACTLTALILAAAVGWVGYANTKAALDSEARKRDEAEQLAGRLEANLRLSLDAFEQVFNAAGGDEFRPPPMGGPGPKGGRGPRGGPGFPGFPGGPAVADAADKTAVLEAVLGFYDKFAEQNATNPRLRLEAAKAHRRVGEMHQWLGHDADKVAGSFRRARELLDGLEAEHPDPPAVRFELMMVLANGPIGPEGTEAQLARAADLGRDITDAPRRFAVGNANLKLGWAREAAGNLPGAEAAYAKAIDLFAPEPGRPLMPHIQTDRATAQYRLAKVQTETGQWAEARRVLEGAVTELQGAMAGGPGPGPRGRGYAEMCRELAAVLDHLGDSAGAQRYRTEADRVMNQFKEPFPKGPFPKGPPKGPGGFPDDPFGRPPGKKDFPPPKPE
jgi:tRNA A-37 threonylcarbamoyl transferase component Bud32/tetratricopeptide (TPR) repeat protein